MPQTWSDGKESQDCFLGLSGSPTPSSAHVKSFGPALLSAGVLSCQLRRHAPASTICVQLMVVFTLGWVAMSAANLSRAGFGPPHCTVLVLVGCGLWARSGIVVLAAKRWHAWSCSNPRTSPLGINYLSYPLLDTVPIHSEYYTRWTWSILWV